MARRFGAAAYEKTVLVREACGSGGAFGSASRRSRIPLV